MHSVNVDAQKLLQQFKGQQFTITFVPRKALSIQALSLEDFEFIRFVDQQKCFAVVNALDAHLMLQNAYICLQTRYKYL